VGVAFLSVASLAYLVGLATVGAALGLIVAALALLAAVTGLCVGCEMYKIGARLRSIQSRHLTRIDLDDLAAEGARLPGGEFVVQFTHPLCTDCHAQRQRLEAEGRAVVAVDVRGRPDLARKYGIDVVPIAVAVGPTGAVSARLAG
jgi:Domain of unknown function (DUF4395)